MELMSTPARRGSDEKTSPDLENQKGATVNDENASLAGTEMDYRYAELGFVDKDLGHEEDRKEDEAREARKKAQREEQKKQKNAQAAEDQKKIKEKQAKEQEEADERIKKEEEEKATRAGKLKEARRRMAEAEEAEKRENERFFFTGGLPEDSRDSSRNRQSIGDQDNLTFGWSRLNFEETFEEQSEGDSKQVTAELVRILSFAENLDQRVKVGDVVKFRQFDDTGSEYWLTGKVKEIKLEKDEKRNIDMYIKQLTYHSKKGKFFGLFPDGFPVLKICTEYLNHYKTKEGFLGFNRNQMEADVFTAPEQVEGEEDIIGSMTLIEAASLFDFARRSISQWESFYEPKTYKKDDPLSKPPTIMQMSCTKGRYSEYYISIAVEVADLEGDVLITSNLDDISKSTLAFGTIVWVPYLRDEMRLKQARIVEVREISKKDLVQELEHLKFLYGETLGEAKDKLRERMDDLLEKLEEMGEKMMRDQFDLLLAGNSASSSPRKSIKGSKVSADAVAENRTCYDVVFLDSGITQLGVREQDIRFSDSDFIYDRIAHGETIYVRRDGKVEYERATCLGKAKSEKWSGLTGNDHDGKGWSPSATSTEMDELWVSISGQGKHRVNRRDCRSISEYQDNMLALGEEVLVLDNRPGQGMQGSLFKITRVHDDLKFRGGTAQFAMNEVIGHEDKVKIPLLGAGCYMCLCCSNKSAATAVESASSDEPTTNYPCQSACSSSYCRNARAGCLTTPAACESVSLVKLKQKAINAGLSTDGHRHELIRRLQCNEPQVKVFVSWPATRQAHRRRKPKSGDGQVATSEHCQLEINYDIKNRSCDECLGYLDPFAYRCTNKKSCSKPKPGSQQPPSGKACTYDICFGCLHKLSEHPEYTMEDIKDLPKTRKHFLHKNAEHELTKVDIGYWHCDVCRLEGGSGARYRCDDCDWDAHPYCLGFENSSNSTTFEVHAVHEHKLFIKMGSTMCSSCKEIKKGDSFSYYCKEKACMVDDSTRFEVCISCAHREGTFNKCFDLVCVESGDKKFGLQSGRLLSNEDALDMFNNSLWIELPSSLYGLVIYEIMMSDKIEDDDFPCGTGFFPLKLQKNMLVSFTLMGLIFLMQATLLWSIWFELPPLPGRLGGSNGVTDDALEGGPLCRSFSGLLLSAVGVFAMYLINPFWDVINETAVAFTSTRYVKINTDGTKVIEIGYTRVDSMFKYIAILACITLELGIDVSLFLTGIYYIMVTSGAGNIVQVCVAIAFISDLDNMSISLVLDKDTIDEHSRDKFEVRSFLSDKPKSKTYVWVQALRLLQPLVILAVDCAFIYGWRHKYCDHIKYTP